MVLTADYQGMASVAFVIKIRKHIDIYLALILVKMDIVWRNRVRESIELMALKHFFFVKSCSNAMLFREIGLFEEVR